ncbi:histidine kinase [Halarcobacter mediterraneus]|uniref:histidine kinase n=1 Tax=Halarcobacter mediterraneus TaxID=2023153 RepID=A0A4Q1B060_9BACT|nr:HAMP domain-containing sensor histidine kinase [Halarcobacter mediterraneus]RXK14372.1 histidine kinase [Halarcobacter mediterraneus]
MNYKKRNFLISNSIVVLFVLLLSLLLNFYLTSFFGFNQNTFIFITISVLIFGLILYLSLSKSIFQPLFKSDENLQKTVKETLHELNIPISTINLNTQMLEKKITDEKALKRLNRIKKASNELLKLYENMEYQIKKEIDKIDNTVFSLKHLIENSLEKVEDIKKDIEISVNLDKEVELKTDINGFGKVLDNLLANAIKYNLKENGIVNISFEKEKLIFFNTGKEIDTKNLFIIFDKYFQENSANDGFGLGLSMVKEFCDQNNILIQIESNKKGNKFILDLKNIVLKSRNL